MRVGLRDDAVYRLANELKRLSYTVEMESSFRTSGLPVCGRLVALQALRKAAYGRLVRRERFTSDTYYRVGTAIHEVYQGGLGRLGVLYGGWRCPKTTRTWIAENEERVSHCGFKETGWGSRPCPKCGTTTEYVELKLHETDHRHLIPEPLPLLKSSHTDGLLHLSPGGIFVRPTDPTTMPNTVLEIKSCSGNYMRKKSKQPKSESHALQASAYVQLIRSAHKFPIEQILFLYVNRDHPFQCHGFFFKPLEGPILRENAVKFMVGRAYTRTAVLPAGRCRNAADAAGFEWSGMAWMGCPSQNDCFGGDGAGGIHAGETEMLESLWDLARRREGSK